MTNGWESWLLVGGPKNGEGIEVTAGLSVVQFASMQPINLLVASGDSYLKKTATYYTYTREMLIVWDHVYVVAHLDAETKRKTLMQELVWYIEEVKRRSASA